MCKKRSGTSLTELLFLLLAVSIGSQGVLWAQAGTEQLLRDPDARVRERAVRDIGNAGNTLYVSSIAALVQDPDEKVRLTVVRALTRLGSDASLTPLTVAMRDGVPEIRYQAI